MNPEALAAARTIWDYHSIRDEPEPSEYVVALGTNDLRVAQYAAGLWARGFAPWMICSGGVAHVGDLLETSWQEPEAEVFAREAARLGVPRERIVLEPRATNTAENVSFTRQLLEERGVRPERVLFAVKPFMARRVRATIAVRWPEPRTLVCSQRMSLDEYFTPELTPEKVTNIMMGDLQRIWIYGRRGWSAEQEIPAAVRAAYDQLAALGFTRHLLREDGSPH